MRDEALEDLLADYVARRDSGEKLTPAEYASQHPAMGDRLLDALKSLERTEGLFPGDAVVPERVGPYVVLRELGRGGMGRVLEAEHEGRPGQPVALKLLTAAATNPRSVARLQREGDILQRLQHDGIVRVFDVGLADGTPFLAMELVRGAGLAARIAAARGGDPGSPACARLDLPGEGGPFERVAHLVAKVAHATATAHAAGLLHRDIKPANVLLRESGHPVLIDFGLAADDAAPTVTRSGDVLGTPHYMPPEQARGHGVSERSDVYGIGAVLHELLTLQPPHPGDDAVVVLHRVQTTPVPPAARLEPHLPRPLATVLHRSLAFDPGRRYAGAAELAADLEAFAHGRPISARPPGLGERAAAVWRFHRTAVLGAAAVLLLAVLTFVAVPSNAAERANRIARAVAAATDAWASGDDARLRAGTRQLAEVEPAHPLLPVLAALVGDTDWPAVVDPGIDDLAAGARALHDGRDEAAFERLSAAVSAAPDDPFRLVLRGVAAFRAGDLDSAAEELASAAKLLPGSAGVRSWQARIYRRLDRDADAERVLEAAVTIDGDNAELWRDLAEARLALEEWEAGLAASSRAMALAGDSADRSTRLIHAAALTRTKNFDQALAIYRRRLAEHPDDVDARYQYAYSLDSAHLLNEARDQYLRVAAERPDNATIHSTIAWLLTGSGFEDCAECRTFFAEHPEVLDPDLAEQHLLQAIELDRGRDARFAPLLVRIAKRSDRTEKLAVRLRELLDEAHDQDDDDRILTLSKAVRSITGR